MFLRPLRDFALFYKVTKAAPIKLTKGDGAFQSYFVVAYTYHFPIATTRPPRYMDLLPYFKGIGAKDCDSMDCHLLSLLSLCPSIYQADGSGVSIKDQLMGLATKAKLTALSRTLAANY